MQKYYIKYMVRGIPYYYEFACYADSEKQAWALFILNVDGIVKDSYIAWVEDIRV